MALKAEVDDAVCSSLCSTASRPFDAPEEGDLAGKVINHYGDEALKVCDNRNGAYGHRCSTKEETSLVSEATLVELALVDK